jgi:hypothetical protein
MTVAGRTGIEPDRLRLLLEGRGPVRAPAPPSRPKGPEVEALRLAVHRPQEVADRLDEVLFSGPMTLAGYRALCSSTTLAQAIETLEAGAEEDQRAGSLLRRLAVEDTDVGVDDVMTRLAMEAGKRAHAELSGAARAGDSSAAGQLVWLGVTIDELREPATAVDATARLVRWLVDRSEVGHEPGK